MKFWITCYKHVDYRSYTLHVEMPVRDKRTGHWISPRRLNVCDSALQIFFGEDYDLPNHGECWEFTTEETIWIHTE